MDFLQTCLQLHLATDEAAAINAPHVISLLTIQHFDSHHASKWTNRVNALIRARDSGARWAGLVLALQTSRLSRALLISSAQTWITNVLPMLSVSTPAIYRMSEGLCAFLRRVKVYQCGKLP